jgi:hypothetical protein
LAEGKRILMRWLLLSAVLCGDPLDYFGGPRAEDASAPLITLNESAITGMVASKPVKTIKIYSPTWCAACQVMKAQAKREGWVDGDSELSIEWYEQESPGAKAYPWAYDASTNKAIYGRTDLPGLRSAFGLDASPVGNAPPVSAGSVDIASMRAILARLPRSARLTIDERWEVNLGSATALVPKGTTAVMAIGDTTAEIRFEGSRPSITAYLVTVGVNGVRLDEDSLTIDLKGWPDWVLHGK